jgi:hypothetical protein
MAKNKTVRGTCTVPGCNRSHKARGYCNAHDQRFRRGADLLRPLAARDNNPPETCAITDCTEPVKSKGLCATHYARKLRHGHTRYPDRKKPTKPCSVHGCENHRYAKGWCHQHYIRDRKLRLAHGIGLAEVDAMLAKQNGVCAICGGLPRSVNGSSGKITDFAVDHDHKTKKVRGLLCSHCNRGIGLFKDDPAILRRAAAYLEAHATP